MQNHNVKVKRTFLPLLFSCSFSFLALSFALTAHAQDITTGLVGHWKFDETSGTSASDSSGNNNTGTLTNSPTWTTGKIGGALSLDGMDDYTDIGTMDVSGSGITIAAWVKADAFPSTIDTRFISKANSTSEQGHYWMLGQTNNGGDKLRFRLKAGGSTQTLIASSGDLPLNTWFHTIATYDGSTMRLYKDGIEVGSVAKSGTIDMDTTIPANIGRNPDGSNHMDGAMDDVRIYNRALSTSDIQALYAYTGGPPDSQAPTTPTNLSVSAVSSSQINLSWTASTDNVGVTGYRVYRGGVQIGTPSGTSYSSTSLSPSTTYSYTVAAVDGAGNISPQSTSAEATTQAPPPPDTQAPTVPTNLSATAQSSSQINLSWTASTDNVGVTGYRVERCTGSSCTTFTQIGTPATNSYSDTGLAANTTYRYRVRAADAAGNLSNYSSIVNATTQVAGSGIPSALGWYQIPNTAIRSVCPSSSMYPQIQGTEGCDAVTADWAGGVFDVNQNRLLIWGGGHGGYAGNELYALDLDTLTVARLNEPSTVIRDGCTNGGTYADGKPVARHSYNHLAYLPNQNTLFMWGGSQWQCGSMAGDTWFFNLGTLSWSKKSSTGGPSPNFGRAVAYDPNNGLVYARDDFNLYSYNPTTDTWATRSSSSGMGDYKTAVIDPVRKKYFLQIDGDSRLYWYDITNSSGTSVLQSGQTTGCSGFIGNYQVGWEHDPAQGRIVGWSGGNTVYILNPDTLSCTTASYSGGPTAMANGTFGRFRYVPTLNVFVVCNDVDVNCYSLRLTSGTPPPPDTTPPSTPTNLITTPISSSQINLAWTASTDNVAVTNYRLERCNGSSCTTFAQIATPATNSYSDTGLAANTTYRYQVRAADVAGNLSGYSSVVSGTTQAQGTGGVPARAKPYTDPACSGSDVFFCEDFEGNDINNLGSNNCGSTWGNPALDNGPYGGAPATFCWAGGGTYQYSTIPLADFNQSTNRVWRVTKTQSFTDVVTGRNTGTGPGTITGYFKQGIATGVKDFHVRFQAYWHPTHTWPSQFDFKTVFVLPRDFIDPPSAPYETGIYMTRGFWCNPPNQNYNDVPQIRYSSNFQSFPYQNEYCPPLSPGVDANGTNAPRLEKNRWYTMEYHVKLAPDNTGILELWLDGKKAYTSNRITCHNGCPDIGYLMVMGWMNSADAQTGYYEIDNIVMSRSYIGPPSGGPPPDTTPPSTPTNLTTSPVSSSQINLNWTASTDNVAVTGYRLERCTGSSCTTFAQIATPTSNSYSDTGLTANTTYRYRVRASDAVPNLSNYSSIVSGVTQSGGGGTADADFQARCSAAGVVKCQGFNTMGTAGSADLVRYDVDSTNANVLPRSDGQYRGSVDSSIKRSGAGSLQFKLDAGYAAPNIAGQYLPQTNNGLGASFRENSDMYVQYAVRFSPEMFSNLNYWNSHWKVSILHQNSESCASKELTTNTFYGGPATMYKDCGAQAMYTQLDGQTWTSNTPLLLQQGDYACQYGATETTPCWNYPTDKWITLYYKVHIGAYGQPNSTIEAWYSVDGQPYKKWINVTSNFSIYCNSSSPCSSESFNNITLTPYMTALGVPAPVDAYVWYDELVVSTQPIAAPSSVTPPPPTLVGDLNGDRTVNGTDWTIMAGVWFTADATADINKDGVVNSIDFSLMNANWGVSI